MLHRAAGISALIAAALAVTIAMAGCASGGTVTDPIVEQTPRGILVPTPGSTISALVVKGSDTVLHAHLLTPASLPAGWNQDPDTAEVGVGVGAESGCPEITDPAYNGLPLRAEAAFTHGSGLRGLTDTLTYGSTGEVDAAWASYVQAMASCRHVALQVRGQTLQTVLSPVPFVRSGDAVDAREAVTTVGPKVSVYFVVTRVGDLLVAVTYSGWGTPSTATVQQYVESALSVAAGIR